MIRLTGLILQPLLPLSLPIAFDYWKKSKTLPKVPYPPPTHPPSPPVSLLPR